MSKSLLYIGNKLSGKGKNLTTIETLTKKLETLSFNVKSYSNQDNRILRLLSMLFGIIKHRKYDLVLIDTYSTSAFWFACACAKLCQALGLKYILILHGGNLPKRLTGRNQLFRDIFTRAKINISPSPYLYKVFKNKGVENLKLIPNTIELKNYPFKARQHLQPKLLWVRAFADIYNPILALKVLKQLIKTYPDAQLSMVGPYKDKSIDECRKYATRHQLPVKFTGQFSKKEWIAYSEHFDIFINTTDVDNTPVSIIEAMALGLPVVSTNVGGLPYLLDHEKEALLVPPGNEFEMYSAIQTLINNPEMVQNMTEHARRKAESFDWEVVKGQWQEVLQ